MTVCSKQHWLMCGVMQVVLMLGCESPQAIAPAEYALRSASVTDDDPDDPNEPGDPNEPSEPDEPGSPDGTTQEPQEPEGPGDTEPEEGDPQTGEPSTTEPTTRTGGAVLNNWGCDTLNGEMTIDSYGPYGACCDEHDTCYEKYGCTMDSFTSRLPEGCGECNDRVIACSFQEVPPGPSICASATDESKKCGKYRSGPM